MSFSARLRQIRESLGLGQTDFASKIGIPRTSLINYEKGTSNPSAEFLAQIKEIFGVSIDWFVSGQGEMLTNLPSKPQQGLAKPAEDYKIPLLRQKVSCGPGVDWETSDNVEEYIDIFSILPRLATGRMYAFKASGSSMLGAGIKSGDYLIFDAELGFIPKDDIYVFTLDGEVYCKRLEFDMLANKIKIYSVRVADLEKAELVRTLDITEASYGDRFRIFGRVRYLLRPNRGED
jgi:transcriptional regulator with XRE-family HTH domain